MKRSWPAIGVAASILIVAACSGDTTAPTVDEALRIFGPYRDGEADRFVASLEPFTEQTGIEVRYTGTADFVTDLLARSGDGNDPPDVAMVPQPGLVRQLLDTGMIVELSPDTQRTIDVNFQPETAVLGVIDDVPAGVPFRITLKSLLWYRPGVFAEHGWTVPTTLDELTQLTDRIAAEPDIAPWCLAIQAGSATGWPATDWIEDLVVRQRGAALYGSWARGELGFDTPPIRAAFDTFSSLVLGQHHLAGGRSAALDSQTTTVFDGLLEPEPACAMVKQASFASSWLPAGTTVGPEGDVDVFLFPGQEAGAEPPIVVGGDLAVQFRRDDRVDALMTFLAGEDGGSGWARRGGLISPRSSFDPAEYPDELTRRLAELAVSADTLVFDASDVMPPDVGTTPYWSGISDWIAGQITLDQLLPALDERFQASLSNSVELTPAADGP